jgi:hypothetical protein
MPSGRYPATGGSVTPGSVTNADLANMPAHRFKGNNTGSTGSPLDLTATQLTAELNVATTSLNGLMSADSAKMELRRGADLTDADITITPGDDKCSLYVLPAGTLTANRAVTVSPTNANSTDTCRIVVRDTSSHTYRINNGGGTQIYLRAASPGCAQAFDLYLSAGQWIANTRYDLKD